MILYCTLNRGTELWYLDLAGQLARPPAAPAIYALASFEGARPRYYVGSSKRLTARLSAHFAFARSRKLRGHSGGGRLLAPVVARRRRALVIVLETCPGANSGRLQRCERAWMLAALRDNGTQVLTDQRPAMAVDLGPLAPATLAARRHWPTVWVNALSGFFREPRPPAQAGSLPGDRSLQRKQRPASPPSIRARGAAAQD
jgi:hypothetical protein